MEAGWQGKGGVISVGDEVEVTKRRKALGRGDAQQVAVLLGGALVAAVAVPIAVFLGVHFAKQ